MSSVFESIPWKSRHLFAQLEPPIREHGDYDGISNISVFRNGNCKLQGSALGARGVGRIQGLIRHGEAEVRSRLGFSLTLGPYGALHGYKIFFDLLLVFMLVLEVEGLVERC